LDINQYKAPRLREWLYGEADHGGGSDFVPTASMTRFREKTSIESILSATKGKRPIDEIFIGSRHHRADRVLRGTVEKARRLFATEYEDQKWFDDWLLRGGEPSHGVRVLLPHETRRCAKAFDYVRICDLANVSHFNHYFIWFNRAPKLIPEGALRLVWLSWLFGSEGYRSAPAFIIGPKLQEYRRQGKLSVVAAESVGNWNVKRWKGNPDTKTLLVEAVKAVAMGRMPMSQGFAALPPQTRTNMIKLAEAATKRKRCTRSGLRVADLSLLLSEANERDAKKALLAYLNNRKPYRSLRPNKIGFISDGLFIASHAFCDFHNRAVELWAQHRVGELSGLAGFDDWFLACVTPLKEGKRRKVPTSNRAVGIRSLLRGSRRQAAAAPAAVSPTRTVIQSDKSVLAEPTKNGSGEVPPAQEVRKKRSRQKHLKWKALRNAGNSYGQIVKIHQAETGESLTREAIIRALNKLKTPQKTC
jgi:hypothetical protein